MAINLHYFELCAYSETLLKLEREKNHLEDGRFTKKLVEDRVWWLAFVNTMMNY
jgi:hypothetical protein